jgi:hypothetical protein
MILPNENSFVLGISYRSGKRCSPAGMTNSHLIELLLGGSRMSRLKVKVLLILTLVVSAGTAIGQEKKPNILFIMGDDIGIMQPECYHRGLMVGETPNIDRLAREGGIFMDYYAMQSCTSGRCAFFTGMEPVRVGLPCRSYQAARLGCVPVHRRSPRSC